ncbi:hypothetical protein ACQ4WP_27820 [Janthinobacterium sp. GB4P2]|uniref:hypothetical protein n=1 Tax=Janthinobacterium sp. GB4P2 TaxID=3424189 RepID=UPI003F2809B7
MSVLSKKEVEEANRGEIMQIVHPCNAFAQRAGFTSWATALEAMKAGKIISASAPKVAKSTGDLNIFHDQARDDGLVVVPVPHGDFGLVSVGFAANFPEQTLKRLEAEAKPIVSLGGHYKTASES